jgi:hypothetical protein
MRRKAPDLGQLDDAVAAKVLDAMRAASSALDQLGVRHVLVGGLAVGAHGHPRATKDVDFLVGDEAFEMHAGGIVTMRPGVPIQVNGVLIDHLSAQHGEEFLEAALPAPVDGVVQVATVEVLVYLKLRSPRPKDRLDVMELIRAGIDVERCKAWLTEHAPAEVEALDRLERDAWTE